MFGINGPEFLILLIIGVLVIGPKRLPEYTQGLMNLVRGVRKMASGAREQIKDEVGIDIDEVDWRKYDPRQYDPRRIIREALLEPEAPAAASAAVGAAAVATAMPEREIPRLAEGESAPFDTEAT
ncbi:MULTISPECIES: twin-arginine translocase TatA/TatE family subunit [Arthrobacter]|uniref:twin-arginine translocase TatA/TatE family subunit n=1 Tax=Arthrobacter TaxID=1663 RepID=UPI0008241930|nr:MULTISPECIES: twin-arginine translocase TatA/TatE family subunit [Arthrobacter]PSS43888.1 Sec-independent protein translocase TatB [Arthrobacter woluwensis]QTF73669.1 Sec-independent protein translocase TatB [Arthrobacter woluwensis]